MTADSKSSMTEPQHLSRALSLGGASAISTGLAFAAINFLGMAQLLDYISGPMSWIAVLAGGLMILGVRAVFSELNGMYPTAAGIRLWMSRAINDRVALIITLTYMTAIVLVIAADAFIIGEAHRPRVQQRTHRRDRLRRRRSWSSPPG